MGNRHGKGGDGGGSGGSGKAGSLVNGPSTTGHPSGGGRGNAPPAPKK
jgi:hypothetical protein